MTERNFNLPRIMQMMEKLAELKLLTMRGSLHSIRSVVFGNLGRKSIRNRMQRSVAVESQGILLLVFDRNFSLQKINFQHEIDYIIQ